MSRITQFAVAPCIVLVAAAWLPAQSVPGEERPTIHVPVRKPTRQELDHAEALKLYALAVIHEHNNRLIEALKTYEEALRLDPDAVAVLRSLVPLYGALDRVPDAFKTCERILELHPDDFETGYLYARQLRLHERSEDASHVLSSLVSRPNLKEFPDLNARVNYDLGLLRETRKEWALAVASYGRAAAVLEHPAPLLDQSGYTQEELIEQIAETYEHMGRVYLKLKKTPEAIAAFEKAQARDPLRAPRLSYNLAEVLINQGELKEALPRLDEYLRTQPQGMEGYELKIGVLRKLKRAAEIVPDLENASGRDPHNDALKLLLAREYRAAKQSRQAEVVYAALIQSRPTPEVFRDWFALCKDEGPTGTSRVLDVLDDAMAKGRDKEGQPGDANAAGRARGMLSALREDPDMVKELLMGVQARIKTVQAGGPKAKSLDSQTRQMFASLAARTRQLDLAEELYRSCLAAGEAGRRRGRERTEHEVYAGLLRVLALAHKNQAILDLCKQGLEQAQATNRVLFHLELSQAYMNLDRVKEALASADDAVNDAGASERLMCLRHRAFLLSQAEKHEQAIAECQAMLKEYNQPGDVRDIRSSLSSVYSAARDQARAEEQLRLILDADPADATANNDLGYLLADQNKKLDEAEKMVRKAIELDRKQRQEGSWVGIDSDLDNAAYVDSLGWVLFRRGKWKEARQELERASQLPTGAEDPVIWDHLGDLCFRQGEKALAEKAWKKSLELYEAGRRRRDDQYKEVKEKLRHP